MNPSTAFLAPLSLLSITLHFPHNSPAVFFSNHLLGINQPNGLVLGRCMPKNLNQPIARHTLLQEENMFQTNQEAVCPLNLQLNQPSQTISVQFIIRLGIMSKARFKLHLTGIAHLTISRRTIILTPTANMSTIIPTKSKDVGSESEISTNIQSN